jgi:hypothetical protein
VEFGSLILVGIDDLVLLYHGFSYLSVLIVVLTSARHLVPRLRKRVSAAKRGNRITGGSPPGMIF